MAGLGDLAYTIQEQSVDITENFVFIEGYLRDNQLKKAYEISELVVEFIPHKFEERICNLWRTVEEDLPLDYDQTADYQDMMGSFCFPE